MAGEREGKLFEAVVFGVLKRYLSPDCSLEWNEDIEGLSVEPDFTLRTKGASLSTVILATFCGSAKESNRKGWRNIGETAEIKKVLGAKVGCLGVTLGKLKPGVETMLEAAMDAHVYEEDDADAARLEKWIIENSNVAGTRNDERQFFVESKWSEIDGYVGWILQGIRESCDPSGHLISLSPIHSLWQDFARLPSGSGCSARNTSFRRGGFKLGVIAATNGVNDTANGIFNLDLIPSSLVELGWFTPRPGGKIEPDREISWSLRFLNADIVQQLLSDFESSDVSEWVSVVSSSKIRKDLCEWLINRLPEYIHSPELLYEDCSKLSRDYLGFCNANDLPALTYMFPYELLVEVIRVAKGSRTAFGYSALERLCSSIDGMPPRNNRFYRIVLSDWVRQRGKEKVNEAHLSKALIVLIEYIASLDWKSVNPGLLSQSYLESTLEYKILTYRGLDPLLSLIEGALPEAKVVYERSPFPVADSGQDGASYFVEYNNCLIYWQSAQGSHTKDKKKELLGRLPSMIYRRTPVEIIRKKYDGHFLILDGTWSQKDINALIAIGWTQIFYPDEVDELISAVS